MAFSIRGVRPLFKVRILNYCFSPTWISVCVTLLIFPLLVNFGIWQLQRAHEKKLLQSSYQARALEAPVLLQPSQLTSKQDWQYRSVKLQGYYDNAHSFLLDNKFFHHQVGYEVITPLIISNVGWAFAATPNKRAPEDVAVLIDRGWIPAGNRATLPSVASVTEKLSLIGTVYVPSKNNFIAASNDQNKNWPRRIEQLDFNFIATETGYKAFPFVVWLAVDQSTGFKREWQPITTKISTHYGYAFQWFALAFTLIIIFIVVNTKKVKQDE